MNNSSNVTLSLLFPQQTSLDTVVSSITEDSRDVSKGALFVARDGEHYKGSQYIESAAQKGAVAAIVDSHSSIVLEQYSIPIFRVENLAKNVGAIAAQVYGNVVELLQIIGVTGTNGKTSCAHYITQALTFFGVSTYIIGTVGNGDPKSLVEANRTTPDACRLHQMLAQYYHQGARAVVMEVSSHALEQGRVSGVPFNLVSYTNLSRDHLDYHGTMQAYAAAKAKLFTEFSAEHQVLNLDDKYNRALYKQCREAAGESLISYGLNDADVTASDIQLEEQGIHFNLVTGGHSIAIRTALLGKFNISNLLLSAASLLRLGYQLENIQSCFSQLTPVPGRMEAVVSDQLEKQLQPLCLVDYAHTPDALEKVLQASRVHCNAKLVVVFGCGGDRDGGKRAEMACIAEREADIVIVTSDNPRTEQPMEIIEQICSGFSATAAYQVISDRAQAIERSVLEAKADDVIVIAGKGHEDYQEIMAVKHPFLDRSVVLDALVLRAKTIQGFTE